jgi:hypothetical protein
VPEHQAWSPRACAASPGRSPRLTVGVGGQIGQPLQPGPDLAQQFPRGLALAGGQPGSDHPQPVRQPSSSRWAASVGPGRRGSDARTAPSSADRWRSAAGGHQGGEQRQVVADLGCHWTARQKAIDWSSTASIVPSGATADTVSPAPARRSLMVVAGHVGLGPAEGLASSDPDDRDRVVAVDRGRRRVIAAADDVRQMLVQGAAPGPRSAAAGRGRSRASAVRPRVPVRSGRARPRPARPGAPRSTPARPRP